MTRRRNGRGPRWEGRILATGALTMLFGSQETSDFWVDGLKVWWDPVRGQFGSVKRLVLYRDNGPKNAGNRTQWLKRLVEFADGSGREIRLVYYPAYPSKYNVIEHCWGVLEQKWGGVLLSDLEGILAQARRMTWRGQSPPVGVLEGTYPTGVRLTKAQRRP